MNWVMEKRVKVWILIGIGHHGRFYLRDKLIGTTSFAFVICNMDKLNLSVASPMSHQFGWNSSTAGLIAISASKNGGAWDNGKKYIEAGVSDHAKSLFF
ncbi:hypothetical protein ACH5RR_004385 [Cinchona calisaya]|uniref:Uncharacterized protein n=1 Tax=Cinchona calisaya TaxID=153742 RepID=A0ABD3AY79_9GENT